jgi:hypothetical protein
VCVITPLAMPSSLSLFPRDAKSRINGGTSVPHDDFRVNPGYPAGEASLYLQSVAAQLLKPCENAVNNTVAAGAHEWKRILCACPDTGKKPAACHRAASISSN